MITIDIGQFLTSWLHRSDATFFVAMDLPAIAMAGPADLGKNKLSNKINSPHQLFAGKE